jgi:predicted deacylase
MNIENNGILTILGHDIPLGTSIEIDFNIAKLYTTTNVDVPVIIERSKIPGPTILFTAGLHGDEVNGVEIVRQIIAKGLNKPKKGTIICMPVLNVFGFLNGNRVFPDGRDLNRVFPGSSTGSLASRMAFRFMHEIIPNVDLILDFHTGGANRFNAAQIRIAKNQPKLEELANIFGAPFVLYSNIIAKSFRAACMKLNKPILLFEGGKSFFIDNSISEIGIQGVKRVLNHFDMLNDKMYGDIKKEPILFIEKSKWIRARKSGMFNLLVGINTFVKIGDILGEITDPYGKIHHPIKSPINGYIINVNEASLIYQGDALFHITTKLKD